MSDPHPRKGGRSLQVVLVAALLSAGCNYMFGIKEGPPRPICADPLVIDDMEDGKGDICKSNGRDGY